MVWHKNVATTDRSKVLIVVMILEKIIQSQAGPYLDLAYLTAVYPTVYWNLNTRAD